MVIYGTYTVSALATKLTELILYIGNHVLYDAAERSVHQCLIQYTVRSVHDSFWRKFSYVVLLFDMLHVTDNDTRYGNTYCTNIFNYILYSLH